MFDKISYLEISVPLASFLNILKLKTKWLVIVTFFPANCARKTFDALSKRNLLGFISPTLCGCDLKVVLLKIEI